MSAIKVGRINFQRILSYAPRSTSEKISSIGGFMSSTAVVVLPTPHLFEAKITIIWTLRHDALP